MVASVIITYTFAIDFPPSLFFFPLGLQDLSSLGRILAPRPVIEPVSSAVKAQNPNHWTTREFPLPSL